MAHKMANGTDHLDGLVRKLTLEDKVSLLATKDWWRTPAIQRDDIFVPHIKTTDGPNGARGESYVSGIRAACFPCGTSMGASFDRKVLYLTGRELALEAKSKAANVLLAPTLNMIRSPRGGRNYETFSEDPLVLGVLSASFVNGCQSQGIAATPKHYVANDTENSRKVLTANMDEQTLREIYMLPFQLTMKLSDPWCFMTSYNRVNGTYVSDSGRLVNDVLRGEWGFEGTVISDWMGVYSTAESINAGVDLEAPGPTNIRGEKLVRAVHDGLVTEETIDKSALRILQLAERLGRFEHPEEAPEREETNESRNAIIRTLGAQNMVILKNHQNVLPLPPKASVALIGQHAMKASLGGGGSARVDSIRAVSPAEGFHAAGFNADAQPGVPVYGALPHADTSILLDSGTKTPHDTPVVIEWFNGSVIGQGICHRERKSLPEYMIKEKWPDYLDRVYCSRMEFAIRPTTTGPHVLSVISTGPAICYVDGEVVYRRPQETDLCPESFYFFKSKLEKRFSHHMEAGRAYNLVLESWYTDPAIVSAPPLNNRLFQGSALRFQEYVDIEQRIADAVEAAMTAEYAVVCVGTTNEIESEGFDRTSMLLSQGEYDEVLAVAAVNPKTILVNFSGGPVDLTPVVDHVAAVVQAWFPGQECGHSLAAALGGEIEPSGKLPFSWPRRDEDNPSHGNFPCSDDLVIRYEEGLDVGYRYYDRPEAPDPLFSFGHGLSYTAFAVSNVHAPKPTFRWLHDIAIVSANVRNIGSRPGATVLQFYVEMENPSALPGRKRPCRELKAFEKIHLAPGEEKIVTVQLDKYGFSIYSEAERSWQICSGTHKVHVGLGSRDLWGFTDVVVRKTEFWQGV
ncbi:glycoside hydrolase [Corynespora cassiicola Philippines]|uniref:beta-glucosidase n=1 Tax=Corynespora cassiicola Philippines TaxID=1448308 RepID=A0A2T2NN78_CORCC|nr:glycoside hydrolase [Corynespora cassiicola Philippines]